MFIAIKGTACFDGNGVELRFIKRAEVEAFLWIALGAALVTNKHLCIFARLDCGFGSTKSTLNLTEATFLVEAARGCLGLSKLLGMYLIFRRFGGGATGLVTNVDPAKGLWLGLSNEGGSSADLSWSIEVVALPSRDNTTRFLFFILFIISVIFFGLCSQ